MAQPVQAMGTSSARAPKRIILTTFGSLGDIHPYIAIALGLKARGHDVVLATGECYRTKIESVGLGFRPVRPDSAVTLDPDAMRRFMNDRWGTMRVLRELMLPAMQETYEDTLAVVNEGADLLVSHPIAFAPRLIAEQTGIPWVSTQITPLGLYSAFDPPLLPGFPGLSSRLRFLGPRFWGPAGRSLKWMTRPWAKPIDRVRARIGLPVATDNPMVDGHSPALVLALFSRLLAEPQSDWPPHTVHTGFPIYDQNGGATVTPELARFLDVGPPPIVFTLGASAAMVAGPFFDQSVAAATRLGRRALLIVGKDTPVRPDALPDGVAVVDYVPFSTVFSRACAVVHAGGIGTSALAMRAGRPMLVVPHAHDQPNNADRLARLGIARVVFHRHYRSARVSAELDQLLGDPAYARRAAQVGERVRNEDGVTAACDALEALLGEKA